MLSAYAHATRCPVLRWRIGSLHSWRTQSERSRAPMLLRSSYAMSGAKLAYAPTLSLGHVH
eukprot:1926455-Rhodomonas_salina.2